MTESDFKRQLFAIAESFTDLHYRACQYDFERMNKAELREQLVADRIELRKKISKIDDMICLIDGPELD